MNAHTAIMVPINPHVKEHAKKASMRRGVRGSGASTHVPSAVNHNRNVIPLTH